MDYLNNTSNTLPRERGQHLRFEFALSSAFTVSPFCFKHLNVRTVSEHNIA